MPNVLSSLVHSKEVERTILYQRKRRKQFLMTTVHFPTVLIQETAAMNLKKSV